jgi:hypothetical protein
LALSRKDRISKASSASSGAVAGVLFEIFRECHAILRRTLQELHFRSAEAIRSSLITHLFAIPALGQREAVTAITVDLTARSR